jgi:alpha-beta hydrolase superfamily lysophospholipase
MQVVTIALAVVAILIAVALAGPRVDRNTAYQAPRLKDDLDDWLQAAESRFGDIIPGTEKTIVWNDPQTREKTDYAFVYLHGFSASRQETAPVTGNIASHFGANVFYTRLQGHGRGQDAMAEGSVSGWTSDVAEAMAIASRLGEKIVLIGCSTGATLAWWASHQEEFRDKITALVLFSPNFSLYDKNSRLLLWPWGKQIAKKVIGPYRSFEPENEQVAKFWTPRYPVEALLPMAAIVDVAADLPPEQQTVPTFLLYSNLDTTVDAKVTNDYFDRLNVPKDRLIIDDPEASSHHVIIGDIMAPERNQGAIDAAIGFLTKLGD